MYCVINQPGELNEGHGHGEDKQVQVEQAFPTRLVACEPVHFKIIIGSDLPVSISATRSSSGNLSIVSHFMEFVAEDKNSGADAIL